MRDLREIRNRRSNRRKGGLFSFFTGALIFLFFSVAIWVFMDWKGIGEKKIVQTLTPGRMIHSGTPRQVSIPSGGEQPSVVSQIPKTVKELNLPSVQISERRGEKSALNPENSQTTNSYDGGPSDSQIQDSSNTEEWVINALDPDNQKPSADSGSVDLTPVRGEQGKMYTIQVAAFREKVRADILIEELKDKGYSAYLQIGMIKKGEDWYRVRVGAFKNREEAKREVDNLPKQGSLPPYITQMVH